MPMVRIARNSQCSEAYKARLSLIIQTALEQHFAVPAGDCFQLFDEYHSGSRVFSADYLSRGRSDNFTLLQITAGKARSEQQKQALYRALAEECHRQLNLNPADLMIIIQFNQASDWSFSNGKMYLPEAV